MDFYYQGFDKKYHKIGEIENLENTIMDMDDALFEDPGTFNTVRRLKNNGNFEQSITVSKEVTGMINAAIDEAIDEIVKRHAEFYDLMWICELAKRYLEEHSE